MEDNKYPKPTEKEASILNTFWVNDNVFGEDIIRDLDYNEQMGTLNDQTK
ncbi:unknown [Bacillus sp. CAG:988]|nr:unknown [Bacillus sp. CAG:988]